MSTYQATTVRSPITEAQIRFILTLDSERDTSHFAEDTLADLLAVRAGTPIERRHASQLIDALKSAPRKVTEPTAPAEITDGIYRTPAGQIVKVQIAKQGSGRLYAKALIIDADAVRDETGKVITPAEVHWEYVSGLVRKLRPEWKLSVVEAQVFGKLYGVCCRCGAELTDEESIELGIGPVCRTKF